MLQGRLSLAASIVFVFASSMCARGSTLPSLPRLDFNDSFPVFQRQVREALGSVRARPNDAAVNGKLGMILDAYEQYDPAAVCYLRAHLLDPKSFEWTYDLGYVELKQGRYRHAAETLRAALRLRPDYLPAMLNLAESLLSTGQLGPAGKVYEEALREDSKSAEAYYGLGRTQAAQGDAKAAVASFERACELFPRYGKAHYALALAYRRLGVPEKAEEHFRLYKANVTTIPPPVDPLRAAVQQLNQSPLALIERGLAMARAGDLQGAIREHLQAVEMDPGDVQAHINLVQLYARTRDYDRALEQYRIAVRLNPNRADCYYNYGVIMFHLQKLAEAEQAFRQAIQINPYYAEPHNNLGYLLEIQGKLKDALVEFREAVEDRPDYRLAHFQIGRILVNEGKYGEAIQEFLKTLKPEDASTPGYLYALGAAYARAGDRPNAILYLRKARHDAEARGQAQLLSSINSDLNALRQSRKAH